MSYCFYTFSSQSRRPSFTPLSVPSRDVGKRRKSLAIGQNYCSDKESEQPRHGYDVDKNTEDKMAQDKEDSTFCINEANQSFGTDHKMAVSTLFSGGGSCGGGVQRTINCRVRQNDNISFDEGDCNKAPNNICLCANSLEDKSTILINVGGQVFETYISTLRKIKTCKLANESEMKMHYRTEKGDYFFDRDPLAFSVILNYLRTGELHLPTYFCGPALQREFQFWEIDEDDIERCCWQPYNTWKTQNRSLEKLEYDRKQSTTHTDLATDRQSPNCWKRSRAVMWTFLQDPSYSTAAKIYAWVSIIFVFFALFSFCADTHPTFKVKAHEVRKFKTLYTFFRMGSTFENTTEVFEPKTRSNFSASNVNDSLSDVLNSTTSNSFRITEDQLLSHPAILIIDMSCVIYFTLEFLVRFVFCPKKIKFLTALQNIIDFIAMLPDYIEFILLFVDTSGKGQIRVVDFIFILRMLRLFRIFRLIRHVPGLWILLYTLKASFNELLLMCVFLLIGMVVFASLMYFAEGESDFTNIPIGFWWSVITMTTVGYGDLFPKTSTGYVIGSLCAVSGLLMIAFTVPIIVSNFVLYYTHVQYGISRQRKHSNKYDKQQEDEEANVNVHVDGNCSHHSVQENKTDEESANIITTSEMKMKHSLNKKKNIGSGDRLDSNSV